MPGRAPAQEARTTLGELFDAAAHRDPAATAVTQCALDGTTRSLTYGELAAEKDALASALRAAGVRPGQRVAVAVPRSLEQVVALVAVVTAGGAYVPLDLAYPDERLAYILADAAPQVVVVDREQQGRFTDLLERAGVAARVLVQGEDLPQAAGPATPDVRRGPGVRHLHLGLDRPAQGRRRPALRGDDAPRQHPAGHGLRPRRRLGPVPLLLLRLRRLGAVGRPRPRRRTARPRLRPDPLAGRLPPAGPRTRRDRPQPDPVRLPPVHRGRPARRRTRHGTAPHRLRR
ncbi:AMP-binding protein [Streptomyces sp. SID4931]|nr:AMP-binding protein [Streptomyces sp. SID4931]